MQDALNVQVDFDAVMARNLRRRIATAQDRGLGLQSNRQWRNITAPKLTRCEICPATENNKKKKQPALVKPRQHKIRRRIQVYAPAAILGNKHFDGIKQAIEHFHRGIERDPEFASWLPSPERILH